MFDILPKRQYKRKISNYLINPKYQLKYIFWLSMTGLVLVALYFFSFYIYINQNYELISRATTITDDVKQLLFKEQQQILVQLFAISVCFLGFVTMAGIVLSHRTAGALYHFKRVFTEIRKGNNKARIRTRLKDDFQDVAQSFNAMMDEVSRRK